MTPGPTLSVFPYADNDPVNKVDPSGMRPTDCDASARVTMQSEIDQLHNQANAGNASQGPPSASLGQGRADAQQRLALLEPTLADANGMCIESYSSSGSGRLVEVAGDIRSAQNVMVMVPGLNTNVANFTTSMQADAKRVQAKAGSSTAVVAWLDYDAPQLSLDDNPFAVTSTGRARQGAPRLARFVNSIGAGKHVTISAHSYGTEVGTIAVAEFGARPKDMILLGSPGVEQGSVSDFGSTSTWVGVSDDDQVAQLDVTNNFGTKTQVPSFGAKRFRTGSASGHSQYYQEGTESLRNIIRIATGDYGDVSPYP